MPKVKSDKPKLIIWKCSEFGHTQRIFYEFEMGYLNLVEFQADSMPATFQRIYVPARSGNNGESLRSWKD